MDSEICSTQTLNPNLQKAIEIDDLDLFKLMYYPYINSYNDSEEYEHYKQLFEETKREISKLYSFVINYINKYFDNVYRSLTISNQRRVINDKIITKNTVIELIKILKMVFMNDSVKILHYILMYVIPIHLNIILTNQKRICICNIVGNFDTDIFELSFGDISQELNDSNTSTTDIPKIIDYSKSDDFLNSWKKKYYKKFQRPAEFNFHHTCY